MWEKAYSVAVRIIRSHSHKHDRRDTGKALETAYRILESITDRNGNVSEECKKEVHLLD